MKVLKYLLPVIFIHFLIFGHFYMLSADNVKIKNFSEDINYLVEQPLDVDSYPKRFFCGNWRPTVGWMHIFSDLGLFVVYLTFSFYLQAMRFKIKEHLTYNQKLLFYTASSFLLTCGLTHLVDAVIFFYPVYNIFLIIKFITYVVSALSAIIFMYLYNEFAEIFWIERRILGIKNGERYNEK